MPQAKPTPASAASPAVQPGTPLQIFKPGRHTAMSGHAIAFSESDLQATVAAYNPALHEAPLVVGHPKADLPAYGWVQTLAYSEGGIDATPAQVNPDFADMVAAGAFKKISAAFYSPDAPGNPVPGVFYLRHVGFLGAQPPAVKGLRNPSFSDTEEGVVEFGEWDDMTNAGLWRNLREWILGKYGPEEADKVLPGYDVRALELGAQEEINKARAEAEAASAAPTPAPLPAFTEPQPQESTVTEAEAALLRTQAAEKDARIAALEAAQVASARAATHAANVAFCEGLAGVLPAWRDVAVATLDHLAEQPVAVEFGEGDARAPLVDGFKAMLAALPAAVEFGETATKARAASGQAAGDDDAQFAETADPERLAQHRAIRAYMNEHKVDYQTAARAVIK